MTGRRALKCLLLLSLAGLVLSPARVHAVHVTEPEDQVARVHWDRLLTFYSDDGRNAMTIRGRIQPRFEYESREAPELADHASFFLRRTRLDFRGHVMDGKMTFRLMPELSRQANLRDAWANVNYSRALQVRIGQYQVPFQWDRDPHNSSNRHQFLERSRPGEEFQLADGRDIGVMVHGRNAGTLSYGAGLFGGQGRNVRRSDSTGVLISGRAGFALAGDYPSTEALLRPLPRTNIAAGLGAYRAGRNTARDWHPWSGPDTEQADVTSGTADLHFQRGVFSSHVSVFSRRVNPRDDVLESYSGEGYNAQAGVLLRPEKFFASVRYSETKPDRSRDEDRSREALLSLQWFHDGHFSKVVFEAGKIRDHSGSRWHDTDVLRVQYQFLF